MVMHVRETTQTLWAGSGAVWRKKPVCGGSDRGYNPSWGEGPQRGYEMVTNEQVYEVLRNCYDPELPVNLVDLGLIYDVKIDDDSVNVVMTLTARGCPAHSFISEQVREEVAKIEGVKSANVQVVWDPPWNMSRLSEAAKLQLGMK